MDDVKREAEKRAKKKDAPIGSAFETEHQRQKNALMNQIGALDGRNIQKIEAHSEQKTDKSKKMRVVAYCRVSTDDIDQAISIKLQIDAYKKKITSNPDWEYMGTYVDM